MQSKPGYPVEPGSFEQWVADNAQQKVTILDSAPTAAIPLITENNIGYFSSKLYFVISGTLYSVSLTTVP